MRTLLVLLLVFASCPGMAEARERIVGLPCENCEAVFEGMPEKLVSRARIGQAAEPGAPMLISGRVTDARGQPAAGVVVYAYQTNAKGVYPTSKANLGRASHRHGLLRAWALTDAQGRYAFDTIRPAGYPGTDLPEHVHMHVIERGRCTSHRRHPVRGRSAPDPGTGPQVRPRPGRVRHRHPDTPRRCLAGHPRHCARPENRRLCQLREMSVRVHGGGDRDLLPSAASRIPLHHPHRREHA
jgi:protocatechuate 3,4-dioxygenase beta subunit